MDIGRVVENRIRRDLDKKYVFLSGPRQVGKSTVAKHLARRFKSSQLFNWDDLRQQRVIARAEWDREADLVVLDEVHKYRKWRQLLKGIYDTEGVRPRILVTGSARLDVFRHGGDSMAGRYFPMTLMPFTLRELAPKNPGETLRQLLRFGGFPEPFLSQSDRAAARWRLSYFERVLREDVRDLSRMTDISGLNLLIESLRETVGSTVNYSNLAADLHTNAMQVKRWIEMLESLYVIFLVRPWHQNVRNAIRKQPKAYFYDTGCVEGKDPDAARLENLTALSLWTRVQYSRTMEGKDAGLHYLRDKQGHEVDFLLTDRRKPKLLIEVKSTRAKIGRGLNYFRERLSVPAVQIVLNLNQPQSVRGVRVLPAATFLAQIP